MSPLRDHSKDSNRSCVAADDTMDDRDHGSDLGPCFDTPYKPTLLHKYQLCTHTGMRVSISDTVTDITKENSHKGRHDQADRDGWAVQNVSLTCTGEPRVSLCTSQSSSLHSGGALFECNTALPKLRGRCRRSLFTGGYTVAEDSVARVPRTNWRAAHAEFIDVVHEARRTGARAQRKRQMCAPGTRYMTPSELKTTSDKAAARRRVPANDGTGSLFTPLPASLPQQTRLPCMPSRVRRQNELFANKVYRLRQEEHVDIGAAQDARASHMSHPCNSGFSHAVPVHKTLHDLGGRGHGDFSHDAPRERKGYVGEVRIIRSNATSVPMLQMFGRV